MAEGRKVCAICGRVLPTKYAVAGRCEIGGCERFFCMLHWHNGNHRCLEHGWKPGGILVTGEADAKKGAVVESESDYTLDTKEIKSAKSPEQEERKMEKTESDDGKELCERAARELPTAKKESIIRSIGGFAMKLGQGAGALAKKISGYKSPDEALGEIEAQIESNRAKREPIARRYEELYRQIVHKKKAYQTAPAARKKILELELKGMVAEYQSLERQMTAYLNNETVLTKVKGRMCELVAMNLNSIREVDIDKLTDKVEGAAEATEDIDGAIGDLDRAGARRERDDGGAFEEALAGFGDELPEESAPGDPLADFPPDAKTEDPLEA